MTYIESKEWTPLAVIHQRITGDFLVLHCFTRTIYYSARHWTPSAFQYYTRAQANHGIFIRKYRSQQFNFDHCFNADASQNDIFQTIGKSLLNSLLILGRNCTVFAYGQTGSGKTFTMLGDAANPGFIPTICTNLLMANLCGYVSFYEVYNHKVFDLLNGDRRPLSIRLHPSGGPYIPDLQKLRLSSLLDLNTLLAIGLESRTKGKTASHHSSSRSHAVFTVHLNGETGPKLHLVDLAGSERPSAYKTTKLEMLEAAHINRSLAALGNVILNLGGKQRRRKFAPYRDSTLTWLLRDSLGGSAQTIMIATISPEANCFQETAKTLRYASRASTIYSSQENQQNAAGRHDDEKLSLLRDELARLRSVLATQSVSNQQCYSICHCQLVNDCSYAIHRENFTSRSCMTSPCSLVGNSPRPTKSVALSPILDTQLGRNSDTNEMDNPPSFSSENSSFWDDEEIPIVNLEDAINAINCKSLIKSENSNKYSTKSDSFIYSFSRIPETGTDPGETPHSSYSHPGENRQIKTDRIDFLSLSNRSFPSEIDRSKFAYLRRFRRKKQCIECNKDTLNEETNESRVENQEEMDHDHDVHIKNQVENQRTIDHSDWKYTAKISSLINHSINRQSKKNGTNSNRRIRYNRSEKMHPKRRISSKIDHFSTSSGSENASPIRFGKSTNHSQMKSVKNCDHMAMFDEDSVEIIGENDDDFGIIDKESILNSTEEFDSIMWESSPSKLAEIISMENANFDGVDSNNIHNQFQSTSEMNIFPSFYIDSFVENLAQEVINSTVMSVVRMENAKKNANFGPEISSEKSEHEAVNTEANTHLEEEIIQTGDRNCVHLKKYAKLQNLANFYEDIVNKDNFVNDSKAAKNDKSLDDYSTTGSSTSSTSSSIISTPTSASQSIGEEIVISTDELNSDEFSNNTADLNKIPVLYSDNIEIEEHAIPNNEIFEQADESFGADELHDEHKIEPQLLKLIANDVKTPEFNTEGVQKMNEKSENYQLTLSSATSSADSIDSSELLNNDFETVKNSYAVMKKTEWENHLQEQVVNVNVVDGIPFITMEPRNNEEKIAETKAIAPEDFDASKSEAVPIIEQQSHIIPIPTEHFPISNCHSEIKHESEDDEDDETFGFTDEESGEEEVDSNELPRKSVSWVDFYGHTLEVAGPSLTLANERQIKPILKSLSPSNPDIHANMRDFVDVESQTDHSGVLPGKSLEKPSSHSYDGNLRTFQKYHIRKLADDLEMLIMERDRTVDALQFSISSLTYFDFISEKTLIYQREFRDKLLESRIELETRIEAICRKLKIEVPVCNKRTKRTIFNREIDSHPNHADNLELTSLLNYPDKLAKLRRAFIGATRGDTKAMLVTNDVIEDKAADSVRNSSIGKKLPIGEFNRLAETLIDRRFNVDDEILCDEGDISNLISAEISEMRKAYESRKNQEV